MIDQYKHQQLRIGSVSPQQISAWANKMLPNGKIIVGEVKQAFTFNFETNKPIKDGLFCERIFGPIKSGICACGNSRKMGDEKENPGFCAECGVEFVDSQIRRYQMGYIKLACPVTHVWYLKRLPSSIANILDKSLNELEGLVYYNFSFARPIVKKPTFLRLRGSFQYEIQSWTDSMTLFFTRLKRRLHVFSKLKFQNREILTGAGAIREQLANLDLRILLDSSLVEWNELEEKLPTGKKSKDQEIRKRKAFLVRRMQLAKHFIQANIEPEWMVLCLLPVLPPELRPIIQLDGGNKIMSSDLNELYRRVLIRNQKLLLLRSDPLNTPGDLLTIQERLLQEAVDTLLDNGIREQPAKDVNNRVYKSFSDFIQGKEGRFRETLLGKRVDYSGRSVIVVGPSLSLSQCGLPREIALELFQTFVIRALIIERLASNLKLAKIQIRKKEPIVWEMLEQVIQEHPVLLNRAPTLHKFGIQAFLPILVEGRAIWLNPLVCKGFNADFDGDQMAVHVPLSLEAQVEARLLMFSNRNLLSPANGDPIVVPTQDMLIGLYILTSGNRRGICVNRYNNPYNGKNYQKERIDHTNYKYTKEKEPIFRNSYDAIVAYRHKRIHLDSPLWLRWPIDSRVISSSEVPLEVHYESLGTYYEIYEDYRIRRNRKKEILSIYIRTTVGNLCFYRQIQEAIEALKEFRSVH